MTDNQFLQWIIKVDKLKISAEKKFGLHACLTSMRYLQEKGYSIHDYQKVLNDFEGGERTTHQSKDFGNTAPTIQAHPHAE